MRMTSRTILPPPSLPAPVNIIEYSSQAEEILETSIVDIVTSFADNSLQN